MLAACGDAKTDNSSSDGSVCSMNVEPRQITFGAVIDLTVSIGPETTFPAN